MLPQSASQGQVRVLFGAVECGPPDQRPCRRPRPAVGADRFRGPFCRSSARGRRPGRPLGPPDHRVAHPSASAARPSRPVRGRSPSHPDGGDSHGIRPQPADAPVARRGVVLLRSGSVLAAAGHPALPGSGARSCLGRVPADHDGERGSALRVCTPRGLGLAYPLATRGLWPHGARSAKCTPPIRRADVGIAPGRRGTSAATAAARLVVTDNRLDTLWSRVRHPQWGWPVTRRRPRRAVPSRTQWPLRVRGPPRLVRAGSCADCA